MGSVTVISTCAEKRPGTFPALKSNIVGVAVGVGDGGWVPGKEVFLGLFAETSLWPLCTWLQVILASDDLMILS